MKRKWMAVTLTAVIVLSGCSFLEEVNGTLNYVNQATEYVNEATEFANEVPAMVDQAITNPQALAELETRLLRMKQEIEAFSNIEPPSIAEKLHQQVIEQNDKALEEINVFLANIENGELDPALVENTELFTTVKELTELSNQIQQLGE
ncbi:DUF6376 family protein [Robertmurraya korlensis]|uniref:DUF6376 family protein n=1 Tax=Robertmurraya korlensis TaxID=519977 RepID=UPI002041F85C|nr:DUF6376 family protein [Robertmurraya korlensis]MCM3600779.1 DUF6376 family protein [Robertmurraya korlensis]